MSSAGYARASSGPALDSHLIDDFLGLSEPTTQTVCGSLQPFLPLYFTMGRPFPSKLPLPGGDVDSHQIYGSLGPPESSTQMTSQSVQPFCRAHYCNRHTDRLTDHATRSATIGRIYNNKAIVDQTSPVPCTPITPFPADPICSERVTVHCQCGRQELIRR